MPRTFPFSAAQRSARGTALFPAPLTREGAIAALSQAKREMRRPARIIRQIHSGAVRPEELQTVLLRHIHCGFSRLEGDAGDALLCLLLHVERRAPDLLSTAWGSDRFGPRPGNTLIEGLIGLATYCDSWIRPIDTWRSRSRLQRVQFSDLARHLLARYDVPLFMDAAWFQGLGEDVFRQQAWFAHVGAGGNLRTAGVPLLLTKKMAHFALQAPVHSIDEALRWGQVLGLGGSPDLAAAVVATRLGSSFDSEDFWRTVVQFLVRHPSLDLDLVRPIVDYIHYRKFEPQEIAGPDGCAELGPPFEPNFSMKSRSLAKLLSRVKRWRQSFSPEVLAAADEPKPAASRTLAYFYHEEMDETTGTPLQWTIQELSSARSLANEGTAMGHCLKSTAVKLGETSIWTVQVRDGERTQRILTVAIDIEKRAVTQARGRYNANPDREAEGPALNAGNGGGARIKGNLSARYRELLLRSHHVLRLWLDREGVAYSERDL